MVVSLTFSRLILKSRSNVGERGGVYVLAAEPMTSGAESSRERDTGLGIEFSSAKGNRSHSVNRLLEYSLHLTFSVMYYRLISSRIFQRFGSKLVPTLPDFEPTVKPLPRITDIAGSSLATSSSGDRFSKPRL